MVDVDGDGDVDVDEALSRGEERRRGVAGQWEGTIASRAVCVRGSGAKVVEDA